MRRAPVVLPVSMPDSRRSTANMAADRPDVPILRWICCTWSSAVRRETTNCCAICRLPHPAARSSGGGERRPQPPVSVSGTANVVRMRGVPSEGSNTTGCPQMIDLRPWSRITARLTVEGVASLHRAVDLAASSRRTRRRI